MKELETTVDPQSQKTRIKIEGIVTEETGTATEIVTGTEIEEIETVTEIVIGTETGTEIGIGETEIGTEIEKRSGRILKNLPKR